MPELKKNEMKEDELKRKVNANKSLEYLPFGEKLKGGMEFIINEILGEEYFTKTMNKHSFMNECYNTFYGMLFEFLNFDELNIGTKEDNEKRNIYYDNHRTALTDEEKVNNEVEYFQYVTKRFFEIHPYLSDNKMWVWYINFIAGTVLFVKNHGRLSIEEIQQKHLELFQELQQHNIQREISKNKSMVSINPQLNSINATDTLIEKIIKIKREIIELNERPTRNKVAKRLGISKSTFYEKIRDMKIDFDSL